MDSHAPENLKPKYKRVILKLSGEGFGHSGKSGISIDETLSIARQAQRVLNSGVQLAIVVGGGNILRGAAVQRRRRGHQGSHRSLHGHAGHGDERAGPAGRAGKPQVRDAADDGHPHGDGGRAVHPPPLHAPPGKGRIVILAGGTGNPFVTTDTAAALRARELEANILLKATTRRWRLQRRPGVEPARRALREVGATRRCLRDNLRVMDMAAISLCQEAQDADPGLQLQARRQHRTRHRRAPHRHPGGVGVATD